MGSGKKKIEIKKIEKESSRMVTFTKRRKGLFKKAQDLQTKTGANVAIIVFSPADNPYTMGDVSLFDIALNKTSVCGFPAADGVEFRQGANAFGASTSYNTSNTAAGLREWLDSINVDGCDEIENLQ